ncbi:MAG: hypothetical protein AM324_010330 [Candidatus Thorarchaeota archaeon SMTZ1-83]
MSIVVDIDDTLIDTKRRLHGVWKSLLDTDVTLEDIEMLTLGDIFMRYATSEQKKRMGELRQRFWDLLLCIEERGSELAELDEPIPDAARILRNWSEQAQMVYLTGRPENTRELTLDQLRRFDFPTENAVLSMYLPEDYSRARGNETGPTLVEARARLLKQICGEYQVFRVVDDYPGYFTLYREQGIPERVGLCRSRAYTPESFLESGATRVVKGWHEL